MKDPFYKHPAAIVETPHVGDATRIWAFAHVLARAVIGRECNVCDHVFIENDVRIGDRVTVKCGVQLWDGVTLEDDVFVGPNVTFTNDPAPRSRRRPERFTPTRVRRGASIGANATILPGVTIGRGAMVGAGAVVTVEVPANAIVSGNPAQIRGYVGSETAAESFRLRPSVEPTAGRCRVKGVSVVPLRLAADARGSLAVAEVGPQLPFVPRRVFFIYDVPTRQVRGEHAHRRQQLLLVCVKGSSSLVVDDGIEREELLLDSPGRGVHLEPMVWAVQYGFSSDAVLAVAASGEYDPDEYVRDYEEFLALAASATAR
jgi:acetyltransferase-like isoleucine patch superfamily enzyme